MAVARSFAMPEPLSAVQSRSRMNRRRATAREVRSGTKGDQGWITGVDDGSLDFLAKGISEQMMLELARAWTVPARGYPTSLKLAELAEGLLLHT
jgi:hypothetical protein